MSLLYACLGLRAGPVPMGMACRGMIACPCMLCSCHSGAAARTVLSRKEIVQILPSNTVEEMESNVERTVQWVRQYQASNNTPAS